MPLPPLVVKALREWKLACPKGVLGLVFPSGTGEVGSHSNILQRHWHPLQLAAGVTVRTIDDKGNRVMRPKYSGLHTLRHFFCSWCAARPQDGGLGLPLKTVQFRMGRVSRGSVGPYNCA